MVILQNNQIKTDMDTLGNPLPPPLGPCSPVCPRCGRPRTTEGQPSHRWFYACGSYLYEGEKALRDRTDICEVVEAMNDAAELLAEIMRDEVNHQDEAEKWLRAYAPQYLANNPGSHNQAQ